MDNISSLITNKNYNWFEFYSKFKGHGKQGVVGLVKLKKNGKDICYAVFKASQYINHLIEHEYSVMKSLSELSPYCPHFCKEYGKVSIPLEINYKKSDNPLKINTTKPFNIDVMFMEYIQGSKKLYNFIETLNKVEALSCIKQVLFGIIFAQREKQFTHYDLHSSNILIDNKYGKDDVFLYVIDKDNQMYVPTYGKCPVIIDFGFSYIGDMSGKPCYQSMGHTDIGFTSSYFDPISDAKLFLVTISSELAEKGRDKIFNRDFRKLVKGLFKPLIIDWDSGWDKYEKYSIADIIAKELDSHTTSESDLFHKKIYICIDALTTLITLPFKPRKSKSLVSSYTLMLREFQKIEEYIDNIEMKMYIFKNIVDIARGVQNAYKKSSTRKTATIQFQRSVTDMINKSVKYCNPKNLSYERLLCSIIVTATNMEGIYYDYITDFKNDKYKQQYNKLSFNKVEDIYGLIDMNFKDTYTFNPNTVVHIWNLATKSKDVLHFNKEIADYINKTPYMSRGNAIYEKYLNRFNKEDFPEDYISDNSDHIDMEKLDEELMGALEDSLHFPTIESPEKELSDKEDNRDLCSKTPLHIEDDGGEIYKKIPLKETEVVKPPSEEVTVKEESKPEPKRRGRPPKPKIDINTIQSQNQPLLVISKPVPAKRTAKGRPRKQPILNLPEI